jgi:hypothetical protein
MGAPTIIRCGVANGCESATKNPLITGFFILGTLKLLKGHRLWAPSGTKSMQVFDFYIESSPLLGTIGHQMRITN